MAGWIAFAFCSLILAAISWKSLRQPGSHGFYRFFAWEAIVGLFLLNVTFWFRAPFMWNQIISWILLFASFIPFGFGIHALRTRGKQSQTRTGADNLFTFEKTTQLITTGIYKYIRHPLYSSLLLLAWGIFFKQVSWPSIVPVLLATLFIFFTARADERECIQFFGAHYQDYMTRTKRFIPFLF